MCGHVWICVYMCIRLRGEACEEKPGRRSLGGEAWEEQQTQAKATNKLKEKQANTSENNQQLKEQIHKSKKQAKAKTIAIKHK